MSYDVLIQTTALIFGILAAMAARALYSISQAQTTKGIIQRIQANKQLAEDAVRFVQQEFRNSSGEAKYDIAVQWLSSYAKRLGIDLKSYEIKGLILAALRKFKDEFGEDWAKYSSGKKTL